MGAALQETVRSARPGPERFGCLASAIVGRTIDVVGTPPGDPPWTDGSAIFIDPLADPMVQLRTLAVQAGLLATGSLEREVLDRLVRRPGVVRRYLAVEGHRALASLEPLMPPSVCGIIDRQLASRSNAPLGSLALATSRAEIPDPPVEFGTIRPRSVRRTADSTAQDLMTAEYASRRLPRDIVRELDDDEWEERARVDLISSPVGGGGAIGRLLKRLLGDMRSSGTGGVPGADPPTRWSTSGASQARSIAATPIRAPTSSGMGEPVSRRGARYPEWDVYRRRYRHGWCTVTEVQPEARVAATLTFPSIHAYRRPLSRLGTDLERRDRQRQGIDIDIDAVVEARVQAAAGTVPRDAVYTDLVRRRRDLSVLILLDVSGSAGEPSATGGTVHEQQRAAAGVLTQALHELGDRVALYAFRSQGRSAVSVLPLKRFADPFDSRVVQQLSGCVPGAYTRLGAAMRHGTAVLERDAGTTRRLLVVLSDGFAYDHGYEGAYGEADARRALAEARRRGIGCLCVSLGAATDAAALQRVFGTAAHARVPRVEQLPRIIGPLFRFGLLAAERQRRTSQRKVRSRERLATERLSA